eukprot:5211504-Lingulodinium_polyedra.AAC.1
MSPLQSSLPRRGTSPALISSSSAAVGRQGRSTGSEVRSTRQACSAPASGAPPASRTPCP